MHRRGRTIATALAGAVALASGAYALGTQAGDGSATASDNPRPALEARFDGPPGFGLDRLADRLGVDDDKLEDALRELRNDGPRPVDVEQELADALGVSSERLREALENVRGDIGERIEHRLEDCKGPGRPDGPGRPGVSFFFGGPDLAEDLAKELDLDEQKVEDALDQVQERQRERLQQRREQFNRELAEKLGIPVERVEDAFPLIGPPSIRHP